MLFVSLHTTVLHVYSFGIHFYMKDININTFPISNFLQGNTLNTSLSMLKKLINKISKICTNVIKAKGEFFDETKL